MLNPRLRLFVLLQNAWAREKPKKDWSYNRWLVYLSESRTGHRLGLMLGFDAFQPDRGEEDERLTRYNLDSRGILPGPQWCFFGNTTGEIAVGNQTLKPNIPHLEGLIRQREPNVVLACGVQARDCIFKIGWGGPVLAIPHPGAPFMVDDDPVFAEARRRLTEGPGGFACESLWKDRDDGTVRSAELPRPPHTRYIVVRDGTSYVMEETSESQVATLTAAGTTVR